MAKPQYVFHVGDRVIERGKNGAIPSVKEESKAIVEQNRQLRRGVVVGFTTKVNARKQTTNYVQVLWDNFKTPSEHASMRLSPLAKTPA